MIIKAPNWKPFYFTMMVSAVLVSEQPKETILPMALCLLCFGVLFLLWAYRMKLQTDLSAIGLIIFFSAIVISLPNAMIHGISARDWLLRGAASFFFLATYFFIPKDDLNGPRFIIKTLLICAFIWAAKIFYALFLDIDKTLISRWTGITHELLFPWNLIGLTILILDKSYPKKIKMLGILLFSLLTIGGGFRMQLLIVALFLSWYIFKNMLRPFVTISSAIFISGLVVVFSTTEAGQTILGRFSELGSESSSGRAMEIEYAAENFKSSPLIGNGLAFPIPIDVTFHDRTDYVKGVARQQSGTYDHVTYMHNQPMYIAMSLGLLGLIGYGVFIIGVFIKNGQTAPRILTGPKRRAVLWSLFSILVATLTAATFIHFQYNLMVASLIAALNIRITPQGVPRAPML